MTLSLSSQPGGGIDSQVTRFIATEFVSGTAAEEEPRRRARSSVSRRPSMLLARPGRAGRSGSLAPVEEARGAVASAGLPRQGAGGDEDTPSLRRITTAAYGMRRAATAVRIRSHGHARRRISMSEAQKGEHPTQRWAVHGSGVTGSSGLGGDGSARFSSSCSVAWATPHFSPSASAAESALDRAQRYRADSEVDEAASWRGPDSTNSDPGCQGTGQSDVSPALEPSVGAAAVVAPSLALPPVQGSGGGGGSGGLHAPHPLDFIARSPSHSVGGDSRASTASRLVCQGSPALASLFVPGGGVSGTSGPRTAPLSDPAAASAVGDGAGCYPNVGWLLRTGEMESRLRSASSTFRATGRFDEGSHAAPSTAGGAAGDEGISPRSLSPVQANAVRLSEAGSLGSPDSKASPDRAAMLKPAGTEAGSALAGNAGEGEALLVLAETDLCEFWLGDAIAKLRAQKEDGDAAAGATPSRALFPAVFALNSCVCRPPQGGPSSSAALERAISCRIAAPGGAEDAVCGGQPCSP